MQQKPLYLSLPEEKLLVTRAAPESFGAFGGIDETPHAKAGALAAAYDPDPAALPVLAPRAPRRMLTGFSGEPVSVMEGANGVPLLVLRVGGNYVITFPDGGTVRTVPLCTTAELPDAEALQGVRYGNLLFILPVRRVFDLAENTVSDCAFTLTDGLFDARGEEGNYRADAVLMPGTTALSYLRERDEVTLSYTLEGEPTQTNVRVTALDTATGTISFAPTLRFAELPSGSVSLTRAFPQLDGLISCGRRLWGYCGNTVYGTSYDSPFGWTGEGAFEESLPTDAGRLTGIGTLSGRTVFFAERAVFAAVNSNGAFALSRYDLPGIRAGDRGSAATVNSRLYYLSATGVTSFTGGNAVAEGLKLAPLTSGSGAGDGRYYRLAATRADGTEILYVFDTVGGRFTAETILSPSRLTAVGNGVYCVAKPDGEALVPALVCLFDGDGGAPLSAWLACDGVTELPAEAVTFWAELGTLCGKDTVIAVGTETALGEDGALTLFASFDGAPRVAVGSLTGAHPRGVYRFPIPRRRYTALTLSLSGSGDCRVYRVLKG